MEEQIFDDISLSFANGPLFRFSFATENDAIDILLEKYPDKIFRAYHFGNREPRWAQAVLRFDEFAWVVIANQFDRWINIYTDTQARAEALEKELRAHLPPPVKKPDEPFFYMLRLDNDTFTAEKVLNETPAMDEDSLSLCYGADALDWVHEFARQTESKPAESPSSTVPLARARALLSPNSCAGFTRAMSFMFYPSASTTCFPARHDRILAIAKPPPAG